MSDTQNDAQGEATGTPISMGVMQQFLKDFSFESPKAPGIFMNQMTQPDVSVNFNVSAKTLKDDIHEVTLDIEVKAETSGEVVFLVEITYAGVVSVTGAQPELLKQILAIEVPRLLFPFAREILANVVRDGGFPPLLINPIDFQGLYNQQMANSAKAAKV